MTHNGAELEKPAGNYLDKITGEDCDALHETPPFVR